MSSPENNPDNPTAQALAKDCAEVMWQADECSRGLGMQIIEVGPGHATVSMKVRQDMLNGQKICHGGLMFTLADSAFAFACNAYNQFAVAQHCSISFLRPVYQDEILTAVATERFREKRSGIYDVVVSNAEGVIVAEFRGLSRTVRGQLIPDHPSGDTAG